MKWCVFVLSPLFLFIATSAAALCAADRVDLRGDWGAATFKVELALTPEDQARGLMHRHELPRNGGMLFIFDSPRTARFWMKNTFIPLDILFFDSRGVLVDFEENAEPLSHRMIVSETEIVAVLEINGGLADQYGINKGSLIRHSLLSHPDSAWQCPDNE